MHVYIQASATTITDCLCRLYEACNFSRKLTSQDMWALCQMAGFCSHPKRGDIQELSSQRWLNFGKWFVG